MQTLIVTLVALAALAVVLRRVIGSMLPKKGQAACPSCQAGDHCEPAPATTTTTAVSPPSADAQPLTLVRSKTH